MDLESQVQYLADRYLNGQDVPERSVSEEAVSGFSELAMHYWKESFQKGDIGSVCEMIGSWGRVLVDNPDHTSIRSYQGFVNASIEAMIYSAMTAQTEKLEQGYKALKPVVETFSEGQDGVIDQVYACMEDIASRKLCPMYKAFIESGDISAFRKRLKSEGTNVSKDGAAALIRDYISDSADIIRLTNSCNPNTYQFLVEFMQVLGNHDIDRSGRLLKNVKGMINTTVHKIYLDPCFNPDVRIRFFDNYVHAVPEHQRQAFLDKEQDRLFTEVEKAAESGNRLLLDAQWSMFEAFTKKYIPDDDDASLNTLREKFYSQPGNHQNP